MGIRPHYHGLVGYMGTVLLATGLSILVKLAASMIYIAILVLTGTRW